MDPGSSERPSPHNVHHGVCCNQVDLIENFQCEMVFLRRKKILDLLQYSTYSPTSMSSSSKPIDINDFKEAIADLGDSNLFSLKVQLENSISKLEETNLILEQEISTVKENLKKETNQGKLDDLKGDLTLFQESIEENMPVISNQRERIHTLNIELTKRGLINEEKSISKEDEGVYL